MGTPWSPSLRAAASTLAVGTLGDDLLEGGGQVGAQFRGFLGLRFFEGWLEMCDASRGCLGCPGSEGVEAQAVVVLEGFQEAALAARPVEEFFGDGQSGFLGHVVNEFLLALDASRRVSASLAGSRATAGSWSRARRS